MSKIRRAPSLIGAAPAMVGFAPKAAMPFYHSKEWLTKRKAYVGAAQAANRYWCSKCGRGGRLYLDHVIEIRDGGEMLDDSNLQLLCHGCHQRKTEAEKAKRVGLAART